MEPVSRFGAGISVAGLHVDPMEEVLCLGEEDSTRTAPVANDGGGARLRNPLCVVFFFLPLIDLRPVRALVLASGMIISTKCQAEKIRLAHLHTIQN